MYLFYVDESGSRGLTKTEPPNHHLFVLTAVGMSEFAWKKFSTEMVKCKNRLLINAQKAALGREFTRLEFKDYETKSTWLRNPKLRERSPLLRLFSTEDIAELVENYYGQMKSRRMRLFAVVADKRKLDAHFDPSRLHRKAWELLCGAVQRFMAEKHSRHQAIFIADDNGKDENYRLAVGHARMLRQTKGKNRSARFANIVEMPLFARSELSLGVQLADLCAYNVYRAFRNKDMEYPHFRRVFPFFHQGEAKSGVPDGLLIFPRTSEIWRGSLPVGDKKRAERPA